MINCWNPEKDSFISREEAEKAAEDITQRWGDQMYVYGCCCGRFHTTKSPQHRPTKKRKKSRERKRAENRQWRRNRRARDRQMKANGGNELRFTVESEGFNDRWLSTSLQSLTIMR